MLNMTRQERAVVSFLLVVGLSGLGINIFAKTRAVAKILRPLSENIGKINLNQADKITLEAVKGIGSKLADRLLEYRQINSGFNSLDELKSIKGITESKYVKIKKYFYLE